MITVKLTVADLYHRRASVEDAERQFAGRQPALHCRDPKRPEATLVNGFRICS